MVNMSASVDSECTTDNDSDNNGNPFISKLLGEMKNKFNKTESSSLEGANQPQSEVTTTTSDNMEDCIVNNNIEAIKQEKEDESSSAEVGECEEDNEKKPRIVLLFKKPSESSSSNKIKKSEEVVSTSNISNNSNRRSLRNKSNSMEEKIEPESTTATTLKRSARRRSKDCNESVLQSAIARKEKSYNESSQPQRLTRTLKPTQKILENLAQAKQEKTGKNVTRSQRGDKFGKSYDSDSNSFEEEKFFRKRKVKYSKKGGKRSKISADSDSESGSNQDVDSYKNSRRSQRISSSRNSKEDVSMEIDDEANTAEQTSIYPAAPECSSVGAQLIASRLCLCTQKTSYYPATVEDEQYCAAIDSVGDKLLGCTRLVDKETPLLRPSHRVPFALFCDTHKNRMVRHNCCPTCGVFCTQGRFTECEMKHQYHRDCQISVGDKECCPHCGAATPEYDVFITMHSPKKPVFLPVQKPQSTTAIKSE